MKPGDRLAGYLVRSLLGAGGMGEVYRAYDEKLGRDVALKVLHAAQAGQESDARFEREVKVLASLSHPNIATIHGFEETAGTRFAVLEMIEGQTLREILEAGPLRVEPALALAVQILEGLVAAHAQQVAHRDLKPENIKITPQGGLKILDFGIARVFDRPTDDADPLTAPTRTSALTTEGTLLGTPGYLSPEQARGRSVDARADLWAFGCVLFEMLSGQRAFPGASVADIIAATLTGEPDWNALPADVPADVTQLLVACLEKDAARRSMRAEDARAQIMSSLESVRTGAREVRRALLVQITFADELEGMPAWSPSGEEIAFTRDSDGIRKLYRQRIGQNGEATPVTRGDRDDILPAWAPDSGGILFVRGRLPGERLEPGDVYGTYDGADIWSIDLATGRESLWLADAYNPDWSPDGASVAIDASFAGPRRIWIVDRRGRNPRQISSDVSEAVAHARPRWSPDGKRIVFQKIKRTQFSVGAIDVATGRAIDVTDSPWADLQPAWSPSGRFVYFSSYRSGGLNVWRVPVSRGGEPAGAPQQVTTGAGQDLEVAVAPVAGRLAFSILRQNASVWVLPVESSTARPTGAAKKLIATSREDSRAAWSPDGRKIAFNSDRAGVMNIWVHDLESGAFRQLTHGAGGDYQASWAPGGDSLAYFSSREGTPGIWTVDIASGETRSLSPPGCIEINPFFSPDGCRIAYQSDRDGRLEVWVMNRDGSDPRRLTDVGVTGHFLRWTRDGRKVIFRCPGGAKPATLSVAVDTPAESSAGNPVGMKDPEPMGVIAGGAHMSLSPDETRILDVVGHKTLYVSAIGGADPEMVFQFEDHDVRIDYPVWSPDGSRVSFDRFVPRGGDVWLLEGFE